MTDVLGQLSTEARRKEHGSVLLSLSLLDSDLGLVEINVFQPDL
jgi:hypothetical protein